VNHCASVFFYFFLFIVDLYFFGNFRQDCHFCTILAFVTFKLIFFFGIIVVELGNIVCVMCQNLLLMCCSWSFGACLVLFTLMTEVVSFTLILFLPFCKLILLFTIIVGAMSFTLLRNYASWCCSCIVPICHLNLMLFVLVIKAMNFALFLLLPFYKFVLLFSIVVEVMSFTLLNIFASWCSSYVVLIHHWNLMWFALVIKVMNFTLFLLLPFCKLIILFMIILGVVSLMLLKLSTNWCCSCAILVHH